MTNRISPDVIVVGARCAGAATAMLLARRGLRVLVVDHARPGSDTMSTHALMRGAVMQLNRWGVLDAVIDAGTPAVRQTRFVYDGTAFDIDLSGDGGTDALYAPRRWLLDSLLVDAARQAGAEVRFETGCKALLFDESGAVCGVRLRDRTGQEEDIHAPLVIGADGRNSVVARQVNAATRQRGTHGSACVYQYVSGVPQRGYRWHFAQPTSGGIIPTNARLSCVFLTVASDTLGDARSTSIQDMAKRLLPSMAEDMGDAVAETRQVAFRGQPGYLKQSDGPGWALVGDAGYFRDPITAHGISDALRDAELLANAITSGMMHGYTAQRDALSQDILDLSDRIAAHDWSMPELQALHFELNRAMKANQAVIAGLDQQHARAA
ncbi:NAD(P)/FAD-dependent oxidoreductase [Oceanibium sediminis]|uniref:NAD(P)/FAD-dependent oxidoreductase n=1 Tax=Oceanibium sediminis TaxID=2026339 RepID=UPI000DD4CD80|nr:NAD(P)/FAD-dependent oxidoreductase [Oceanibium sediminis]